MSQTAFKLTTLSCLFNFFGLSDFIPLVVRRESSVLPETVGESALVEGVAERTTPPQREQNSTVLTVQRPHS